MTKAIAEKIEELAEMFNKYSSCTVDSNKAVSYKLGLVDGARAHSDLVKAELIAVRDTMRIILGNYALMDMYDFAVREALKKLEGLIDE